MHCDILIKEENLYFKLTFKKTEFFQIKMSHNKFFFFFFANSLRSISFFFFFLTNFPSEGFYKIQPCFKQCFLNISCLPFNSSKTANRQCQMLSRIMLSSEQVKEDIFNDS